MYFAFVMYVTAVCDSVAGAMKMIHEALGVAPLAADAKLLLAVATIVDGSWSGVVDASSNKPDVLTLASSIIGHCRPHSITSRSSVHCADMLFEGGYVEGAITLLEGKPMNVACTAPVYG